MKISKEDLKEKLHYSGIPELSQKSNAISKELINKCKDEEKLIKTLDNLKKAYTVIEKYTPKTIFDESYFTPKNLIDYIDWQLGYLKEKYTPYGLELPFNTLKKAHKWLVDESLGGKLSIERIECPALSHKDREIYIGSQISMPYKTRINDKGIKVKDSVICNYSPFLIELNHLVNGLKNDTGIDEIEIVNHFLCGKSMEFSRIKGIVAADTLNQYLTIQINTNDLTKDEWNEMYDAYRINTNRKHKKQLSSDNVKLSNILDELEIPEKPNAAFFRQLIKKWNKVTGNNMEEEKWRAMRNRFKTVMDYKNNTSSFYNSMLDIINNTK